MSWTAGGSGTVTHTIGALTTGNFVLGNGGADVKDAGWAIVPLSNGGTGVSTTFTQGSVVFAGASGLYAQDNTNLFFDNANNRLGIGTATPSSTLDVKGIFRLTGSSSGYSTFTAPATGSNIAYTLPGADGTKGFGFTTDGSGTISWQDVGAINCKVYGATGDGVTDDRANLQTCITAASGKRAYIPPGNYLIKATLLVPSNTQVVGAGYGSRIFANDTFVPIDVSWYTVSGVYAMVSNSGFATGAENTNIEVSNLFFEWTGVYMYNTGVYMYNTTGVRVHHSYCNGLAGCTAMLASSQYQITNNITWGATNSAYDNWEGSHDYVIADNFASTAAGGAGIFVNGMKTDGTTAHAYNVTVTGNVIVAGGGAANGQGIYVSGLPGGSTAKYATVTGNTVKSSGSNTFINAIDIRLGGNTVVSANTVSGGHAVGIYVATTYNSVTGNTVTGAVYGLHFDTGADYNMVSGNVVQGSSSGAFVDSGTGNNDTTNSSANTLNIVHA